MRESSDDPVETTAAAGFERPDEDLQRLMRDVSLVAVLRRNVSYPKHTCQGAFLRKIELLDRKYVPISVSGAMMNMGCPHCGSLDNQRIARRGIDAIRRLFGYWPHWCRACHRRFHTRDRRSGRRAAEPMATSTAWRPSFTSRKEATTPTAAVLIRAESDEQLTNILMSLSRAVERHSEHVGMPEEACSGWSRAQSCHPL
jgi:transcriptional regulator NrdR family protein